MQFSAIVEQEETKAHLLEALHSGRLPHALMLRGPAGVGKLAMAHAIAQYLNCQQPGETDSCGKCASCLKISKGVHPDIHYVLPIISSSVSSKPVLTDAYLKDFREQYFQEPYVSFERWQRVMGAENKQLMISVHEIRELKRKIALKAFEGRYKVVIIWQAELINVQGANAFLKLLEEPPERTVILMTCSDPSRLLVTINSRCQQVGMGRLSPEAIAAYLRGHKAIEESRSAEVAAIAEGSISAALELLEEGNAALSDLYINWLRRVYAGNYAKIQEEIEKIYSESKEFQKLFLTFALKKMRDSLLFHLGAGDLALAPSSEREFHANFSQLLSPQKVEQISRLVDQSRRELSGNANPQLVFTALSLRMHGVLRM